MTKDNAKILVDLISKHPELPVVAKVDTDICASDEFSWWIASIGVPYVDEYYDDGNAVRIKSLDFDDLVDKYVEEYYEVPYFPEIPDFELEEIAYEEVKSYNWIKAILLPIIL